MTGREERGLILAALCKLTQVDNHWVVPSQTTSDRKYLVDLGRGTCTCPDFADTGKPCKHQFAVQFTLKRECSADGTVTETRTVTFAEKKVYTQNWRAYNLAQSIEKERFQMLLHDLCSGIPEPDRGNRPGRKPHPIKDALFAMAYKVYSTFSSRRFSTDLRDAHAKGYIGCPIPGVKVTAFHENPMFTPILKALIARSATPLKAVETDFAIDSTGFSSSKFDRWFDEKHGVPRRKCVWVKAHAAVGVKTNVVTAVRILDKVTADVTQFVPLLKDTAASFKIGEVSGDKAYASLENFEAVADMGGTGFMAFKNNATGGVGGLFEKMLGYFQLHRDDYLAHYHKRSNVESTFSAIKRKFGDAVRSKTDTAMVNEVLCKILAFNLTCVIQEQCELGIAADFWPEIAKGDTGNADEPAILPMVRPV